MGEASEDGAVRAKQVSRAYIAGAASRWEECSASELQVMRA